MNFQIIIYAAFLLMLVMITYQIISLRRLIYNVIYNDVYELMNQIMYDVFNRLGDSDKDKAFRSYLRDQRDDLYRRYMDAKRIGLELFKDNNFIQDVLGSTRTDLMKFGHYDDEFIRQVEQSNKANMKRLLDMMLLDAKKPNYRKALKLNTLNAYKKTINDIYRLYRQNQALKSHVVFESDDSSNFMRFVNRVELNKKELLDIVSNGLIEEAIDVLYSLPLEKANRDMIVMLKNRISTYKKNDISGTAQETELQKITKSVIDFINNI